MEFSGRKFKKIDLKILGIKRSCMFIIKKFKWFDTGQT